MNFNKKLIACSALNILLSFFFNLSFGKEINFELKDDLINNKTYASLGWNFVGDWKNKINWNDAKVVNAEVDYGSGVHVGVFDGYVHYPHIEFDSLSNGRWVFVDGSDALLGSDNSEHGTHVAGLIAGENSGVAKKVEMTNFLIFPDIGVGPNYFTMQEWIRSTKFRDIHVANHSWGFNCREGRQCKDWYHDKNYMKALKSTSNSTLHVIAAGNHNASIKSARSKNFKKNFFKSYLKNVLLVGALNKKETKLANFSVDPGNGCFKGKKEKNCNKNNSYKYFFVVAPGYTLSAGSTGPIAASSMAGTSMATPIVTGQAALIKAKWAHLKPTQIREIIMKTATDMGKRGVDNIYGWGKINISKSLSPIKGKVGGVNIRSRNLVFTTASSMNLLEKAPLITDVYGRDFSLSTMDSVELSQTFNYIPLSDSSESVNSQGFYIDDSENVIGAHFEDIFFSTKIIDNRNLNNSPVVESELVLIPAFLAKTNPNANNFSYRLNENSVFYVTKSEVSDGSATQPSIIGMNYQLLKNDKTSLTLKFANVEETGFYGVSSKVGFGFTQRSNSSYYGTTLNHSLNDQLQLSLGLNSLQSNFQEEGKYVSRSNLGAVSYDIGLNNRIDADSEISLNFDSGNTAHGKIETQIYDLADPSSFYTSNPSLSLNYKHQNKDEDYSLSFFGRANNTQGSLGAMINFRY